MSVMTSLSWSLNFGQTFVISLSKFWPQHFKSSLGSMLFTIKAIVIRIYYLKLCQFIWWTPATLCNGLWYHKLIVMTPGTKSNFNDCQLLVTLPTSIWTRQELIAPLSSPPSKKPSTYWWWSELDQYLSWNISNKLAGLKAILVYNSAESQG